MLKPHGASSSLEPRSRAAGMFRWTRAMKIAVALSTLFATLAAVGIAATGPAVRSIGVDAGAQAVFGKARAYTVLVRTRIVDPFIEDSRGSSEGAGFLVDAERGWIVTNAHVVGQSPSDVEVAFFGESFVPAEKIYVDSFADVAVIAVAKVPAGRKAATIDGSGAVEIGEPIGVFGHPLGMHFTGTRGIVSNLTDQDGPDLIQIDATVDHGNSGGPVIALGDGRVVGIATAGALGDKSDRLNFATPMKDVSRILDLLRRGVSPAPPRMEIGLLRDEFGSHTMEVARSFAPSRWPLEPGDRILAVEGAGEVETLTDLTSALRGRGGNATLRIERGGETRPVVVTPASIPTTTERRGIKLDGALIAPHDFHDGAMMVRPWSLIVHSVEPGSAAEAARMNEFDVVDVVDGRRFETFDALAAYLRERDGAEPVRLTLLRFNGGSRICDFQVRELPGEAIEAVGAAASAVAAAR